MRHVDAMRQLRAPFVRVRPSVLRDAFAGVAVATLGRHRFDIELEVPLGAGAAMTQRVDCELGLFTEADDGLSAPLLWRATGRRRLFPVFRGTVTVAENGKGAVLAVEGEYSPPLSVLGRAGDRILGRRAARASLRGFAERLAGRIDKAVDREREHTWWQTAAPELPEHLGVQRMRATLQ